MTNKKKHLVVSPGLPRSGTTYTFHSISQKANRDFFNIPYKKELNFFSRDQTAEEFTDQYDSDDDNKYYIDYSPSYLVGAPNSIGRIQRYSGIFNFKFILHLRHPVDQMYAHYLHDLKAHISTRQRGDDVHYSFFSRKALKKYCALRSHAIQKLVDTFGKENILTVNFYRDIPRPDFLRRKISDFLQVPLCPFLSKKVGAGGWMPYYIYSEDGDRRLFVGNTIKRLPPRTLLLVNGDQTQLWHKVDKEAATRLIEGSSSWTRELTPEQIQCILEVVNEDWKNTLSLLGENESEYPIPDRLNALPAPVNANLLSDLKPLNSSLRDHISKFAYTAG